MKIHLQVNRASRVSGKIYGYVACLNKLVRWPLSLDPHAVTCKHCQRKIRQGIQLKLDLE